MSPKPSTRARRDANEREIIETFEALGWSVSQEGPLDLIIGKPSRTVLIEVKDGSKTPSRQKLTGAERKFIAGWRGECYIVRSQEDARAVSRNSPTAYVPKSRYPNLQDEIRQIRRGLEGR